MRCLCKSGSADCVDTKYDHAHVEYYGTCRDVEVLLTSSLCAKKEKIMREFLPCV